MAVASKVCAFHKERKAITFCESCNRPICRECILTDQVLPRFYFSFWSRPNYRFLCPRCYIKWHDPKVAVLHKARRKRTILWVAAVLVGFVIPLLVEAFALQLLYFLPLEVVENIMSFFLLPMFFSMIFLIPFFLLFIVILRKLSGYPKKARRIMESTRSI